MDAPPITAADLLSKNSPWRNHEIWDGLPVVRDPCGGEAEVVAAQIVIALGTHVNERNLGHVFLSSQGFLVARHPDRLLASDGAYVSRRRLPSVPKVGFVELAPDFCIEVRSPTDSWEATIEKSGIWVAHGTSVVWAVDPLARRVAVFGPGLTSKVVEAGRIDAAPALPDFSLDLVDVFPR